MAVGFQWLRVQGLRLHRDMREENSDTPKQEFLNM